MSFTFITLKEPQSSPECLAAVAAARIKEHEAHVALAESCTGGLIAKMLTDISGASDIFECGIVSYSEAVKKKLLGVNAETLERYSVVSAEVAAEMAEGVRRLAGAELGIGVTGVAGPGPDNGHPEGEIFISLSAPDGTYVYRMLSGTDGERRKNRECAAAFAFSMIIDYFDR